MTSGTTAAATPLHGGGGTIMRVELMEKSLSDAFLAEIGRVDIEGFRPEHQLDRLRGGAIVFNQQYAHVRVSLQRKGWNTNPAHS
jgi:hypothetical protein